MCGQLFLISKYIGAQKSTDLVLPELKELLDDEESEVMSEAIIQFQKHLDQVYDRQFRESQEAKDMFLKVCDLAVDCNMCMTELGTLLRKLGKFMVAFNKPTDA